MRYMVLDVETTGLDPKINQVLEIAALIDDTTSSAPLHECPMFHRVIHWPALNCTPAAAVMNIDLIKRMKSEGQPFDSVCGDWLTFCHEYYSRTDHINVAGKSVLNFDIPFLRNMFSKSGYNFPNVHHSPLELGPLWLDVEDDKHMPSLQICYERACEVEPLDETKFSNPLALHTAFGDVIKTAHALRVAFK